RGGSESADRARLPGRRAWRSPETRTPQGRRALFGQPALRPADRIHRHPVRGRVTGGSPFTDPPGGRPPSKVAVNVKSDIHPTICPDTRAAIAVASARSLSSENW